MTKHDPIDLFAVWTPIDVTKSAESDKDPLKAPIAGIVSTEGIDLQGDTIIQSGCDWDYFLKNGWLNYEHKQGPEYIVGYPTNVTSKLHNGKEATSIEGYLLLDRPRAKEVYDSAKAIQKASDGRAIGFSVEGQVLQRDKEDHKIITKARILNVSITAHPVNPDARLEVLARSLLETNSSGESEDKPDTLGEDSKSGDMSMLAEAVEKGAVGYQQPSVPSPQASLSPLVAQDIDGHPSEASPPTEEEDISKLLEGMMRRVLKEEMGKMMSSEVDRLMDTPKDYANKDSVKDTEKSANLRPPMVSLPQMTTLLGKVFPQLPASEQRAMARKLLSSAKSYHS
jgi:hypothetical protein